MYCWVLCRNKKRCVFVLLFLRLIFTYLKLKTLQFRKPVTIVFLKSISSPAWMVFTCGISMGSILDMLNSGTPAARMGIAFCEDSRRHLVSASWHGLMKGAESYLNYIIIVQLTGYRGVIVPLHLQHNADNLQLAPYLINYLPVIVPSKLVQPV